jgi:hypothetical protein
MELEEIIQLIAESIGEVGENADFGDMFDSLIEQGIDLTQYSIEEIREVLDGAFENSTDLDDAYNVSFGSTEGSDGFIKDGKIELERTVSGSTDTFEHYTKDGHDYVKVGGTYIRVDSGKYVNINNICYDTV